MVKCPKCGAKNPNYIIYCGKCGEQIPEDLRRAAEAEPEPEPAQTASVPVPTSPTPGPAAPAQEATKRCNWCGTYNKTSASFCSNCGRDPYRVTPYDAGTAWEPIQESPRSGVPLIGGILAILAGILALGQGVIYAMANEIATTQGFTEIAGSLCVCSGIDILFGLASVVGGIFAIQRKHFALALIGAILGMLGIGFVIGALFGLIALVLIAVSKAEFED